jgi:hypothetical protein
MLPYAKAMVRTAARDANRIAGLTHRFYRYPARFSPAFARACIEAYSRPGDLVLDPYMGGGTTVLEAYVSGRRSIGSDINSLAVFVAEAKLIGLAPDEVDAVRAWANEVVTSIRCDDALTLVDPAIMRMPRNLTLPNVRWLRKFIALTLESIEGAIKTSKGRKFARCVILNVGQWALNGRRRIPTAEDFRARVAQVAEEMLSAQGELKSHLDVCGINAFTPLLRQNDAEAIHSDGQIRDFGLADLIVTSPPYPGIHMLYHRWQVDGRKESDAPYWIAACADGAGAAYYNFAGRESLTHQRYFEKALRSFSSIRKIIRTGGVLAQMVAFSEPARQLRAYLRIMGQAGFEEMRAHGEKRIWRDVPGRRWHANLRGSTASSKEVVLLHVAA